jgi:hypothetical protein
MFSFSRRSTVSTALRTEKGAQELAPEPEQEMLGVNSPNPDPMLRQAIN